MKQYKVTCLECGESDVLTIDDQRHTVVDYIRKMKTNFQSFRWRGDMQWGFFCQCGNDNRLAKSEHGDIDSLVSADPVSLDKIIASLAIPDEAQFKMETV